MRRWKGAEVTTKDGVWAGHKPWTLTVSDLLPNSHAWHLGRSQGQSCPLSLPLCPLEGAGDEEQKFQKLSITSYEECAIAS